MMVESPNECGRARRERGNFITKQPPKGVKDDYDSENTWISGGLTSSSRKQRRGEGRGEGERWRKNESSSEVDVGVGGAKSKIENRRGHECSAEDFSASVREIIVVGTEVIVIVGHHSARACISMPGCNFDSRAYIGFLGVIIKARGGTTS